MKNRYKPRCSVGTNGVVARITLADGSEHSGHGYTVSSALYFLAGNVETYLNNQKFLITSESGKGHKVYGKEVKMTYNIYTEKFLCQAEAKNGYMCYGEGGTAHASVLDLASNVLKENSRKRKVKWWKFWLKN